MVPSTGHDEHKSSVIPGSLEIVNGGYTTTWIHPIVVPICVEA